MFALQGHRGGRFLMSEISLKGRESVCACVYVCVCACVCVCVCVCMCACVFADQNGGVVRAGGRKFNFGKLKA